MEQGSGWEQPSLEEQPHGQVCNRCGQWKPATAFKVTHGRLLQPCKDDWGKGLPPLPNKCQNPECAKVFTPKRNGWTRFCSERCSCTVRRRRLGQLPKEKRFRPAYLDAGEKRCSHCKETKPLDDFPLTHDTKIGARTAWCRLCQNSKNSRRKREERAAQGRRLGFPVGTVRPRGPYLIEKRPGHHRAMKNGWVLQHILVAEEKYGFPITRDFTVHHMNDDKTDNRPENLDLRIGHKKDQVVIGKAPVAAVVDGGQRPPGRRGAPGQLDAGRVHSRRRG